MTPDLSVNGIDDLTLDREDHRVFFDEKVILTSSRCLQEVRIFSLSLGI